MDLRRHCVISNTVQALCDDLVHRVRSMSTSDRPLDLPLSIAKLDRDTGIMQPVLGAIFELRVGMDAYTSFAICIHWVAEDKLTFHGQACRRTHTGVQTAHRSAPLVFARTSTKLSWRLRDTPIPTDCYAIVIHQATGLFG